MAAPEKILATSPYHERAQNSIRGGSGVDDGRRRTRRQRCRDIMLGVCLAACVQQMVQFDEFAIVSQLSVETGKSAVLALITKSKKDSHAEAEQILVEEFDEWSYQSRMEVFQKQQSGVIFWGGNEQLDLFPQTFLEDISFVFVPSKLAEKLNITTAANATEVWSSTGTSSSAAAARDIVFEGQMCTAAQHFRAGGSKKRHVLITHLNENWGAFSGRVQNRTVSWATMQETLGKDCTMEEIMEYINHPNTLGVFTSQFQFDFDHPKVISIPLGVKDKMIPYEHPVGVNRTQLLMINAAPSPTRAPQIETVIRNFGELGVIVNNTYNINGKGQNRYYDELRRSKFVLSPSGLG